MKNGFVKIVACIGIGAAITSLCLTDPGFDYVVVDVMW